MKLRSVVTSLAVSALVVLACGGVAQAAPSPTPGLTQGAFPVDGVPWVTFTPGPSPDVTTEYQWSGSDTENYGEIVDGVYEQIGTFQVQWVANLSGGRVQLTQHATWLTGPELQMNEQWQCWTASGSLCNVFPNEYTWSFPYSFAVVGYTYTPSNANTYATMSNGYNYIHLNWNWDAQGVPDTDNSNGRFNATPLISPPIVCNLKETVPCYFS
jgi:hypothetical protein